MPKFAQPGAVRTNAVTGRREVDPDDFLDDTDCAKAEAKSIRREREATLRVKAAPPQQAVATTRAAITASTTTVAQENLLPVSSNAAQAAPIEDRANMPLLGHSSRQSAGAGPLPSSPAAPHATPVPRPVVLPSAAPTAPPPGSVKTKEPSLLAIRFMKWLQTGLADGSIKHNELGAPVHFVEHGMALVSPLIFKEYAMRFGESLTEDAEESSAQAATPTPSEPSRLGLVVQREVIRAQWHLQAPGGMNVWAFQVKRRGTGRASRLSAVVLRDPQRWVMPVPPPNPYITPAAADAEGGKTSSPVD